MSTLSGKYKERETSVKIFTTYFDRDFPRDIQISTEV